MRRYITLALLPLLILLFFAGELLAAKDMDIRYLQVNLVLSRLRVRNYLEVDYSGTYADALNVNYTGSGNNIFDFQADSVSVLKLAKDGTLTLVGTLFSTSLTIGAGTKHDGYVINDSAELQTGEVTQEHIETFTLVDNNVYVFTAIVAAFEDGVNRAGYEIKVVAYRDGGGAALQGGVVSAITSESEAAWDVTFTVSGNDIRVSVTGEASTTIEWGCTLTNINIGP